MPSTFDLPGAVQQVQYSADPPERTVDMRVNLRRLLGLAAILILIWWIVNEPSRAANSFENILDTLEGWAQNVTTFFTKVVT